MYEEQAIGVIPQALRKTGMFRSTPFTLVATNRRLIAAQVTDAVKRAHDAEQKAAGRGPRMGGLLGRGDAAPLADRYRYMHPDAIAAESPANLVFVPGAVRDIVIQRGERARDEDTMESYLFIRITDDRGFHDYSTGAEVPRYADAVALLRAVFGPVVRTG
jgi:hypothetical protein